MPEWCERRDSWMPYQEWHEFSCHPEMFVEIANAYGDIRRGYVKDFWWGYETELGQIGEGVITKARRIERCRIKAGSSR